MLETDPGEARRIARAALAPYVAFENYANNWRRLGFSDADLCGGRLRPLRRRQDHLAVKEAAIRRRIQQH